MAVDSYLELFTTLFGWKWYGIVWDVLASTGIVLIPFAALLLRAWRDSARGGSYGSVHELALRSVELEFYVAIFVAIIAGPPTVTLSASMMSYQAPPTLSQPNPPPATPASPRSTYGSAGAFAGAPASVRIPVWWYTVLALTKGIDHAILAGIPDAVGIREVQEQAKLASITDPVLRAEVARFYSECFVPARSRYMREKPTGSVVAGILSDFGEDDPDWIGSHLYLTFYYPNMRAMRPVAGWAYDPTRDKDFDPALPHTAGSPWCSQWWTDPNQGLKARILALPEASSLKNMLSAAATKLAGWFPSMTHAAQKIADDAVRAALNNSRVEASGSYQPDNMEREDRSTIWGMAQDLGTVVGAAGANFMFGTLLKTLKPMLPIAQAVLLMIVYALLPLIVVMSGYSLSMLATVALGIFTINFWTVLWKLAQWIDEKLVASMFDGVGAMDRVMATMSHDGLMGGVAKDFLLDTFFAMLLIGMPLIWTMLMGWVGIRVGSAMQGVMSEITDNSKDAGKSGANSVKKAASGARGLFRGRK